MQENKTTTSAPPADGTEIVMETIWSTLVLDSDARLKKNITVS